MLPFWTNSNFTHVFSHSCFSTSVVCDLPGFKVIAAVLTHTTAAMTVLHSSCLLIAESRILESLVDHFTCVPCNQAKLPLT